MGILAKKNLLRLLAFFTGISLFSQGLIFADDRSVSFFKEDTSGEEDCKPCIKEPDALNPALKKKIEEIGKEASKNFASKGESIDGEVILFINPESSFSDGAVRTLVRFKKEHPAWKCKGVILSGPRGLKEKLLQKKDYFAADIDFSVDINGKEAREFNVTKTPSYVVIHQGRSCKVTGQPDLDEIVSRIDK